MSHPKSANLDSMERRALAAPILAALTKWHEEERAEFDRRGGYSSSGSDDFGNAVRRLRQASDLVVEAMTLKVVSA